MIVFINFIYLYVFISEEHTSRRIVKHSQATRSTTDNSNSSSSSSNIINRMHSTETTKGTEQKISARCDGTRLTLNTSALSTRPVLHRCRCRRRRRFRRFNQRRSPFHRRWRRHIMGQLRCFTDRRSRRTSTDLPDLTLLKCSVKPLPLLLPSNLSQLMIYVRQVLTNPV